MFYHILYPLREYYFAFNVFGYISFRAIGAALTALFISFILGPRIINILKYKQIGETIRKDGPKTHLKKEGTPTMWFNCFISNYTTNTNVDKNYIKTYFINSNVYFMDGRNWIS
jgi:hypothetical protein